MATLKLQYIAEHQRSGVMATIEKFYVGRQESITGFAWGVLREGKIRCTCSIWRKDLLALHYTKGHGRIYVIVDYDGSWHVSSASADVGAIDQEQIRMDVHNAIQERRDWWQYENDFLIVADQIKDAIDGMTPEDAIEIFHMYGF